MIVRRTLLALVVFALALAGCPAPSDPGEPGTDDDDDDGVDDDDDDAFVPVGPPVIAVLVDSAPEDDAEGFVAADAAVGVRYGDPFTVVVSNLFPGKRVTLEAALYGMQSPATFVARSDGTVDLRRAAPEEGTGTYEGVDAEGLLWSMNGAPAAGALDLTVSVRARVGGEEVAAASLRRKSINDGLVLQNVDDGRTKGVLAMPAGDGPFAAVLVFGGSEGGTGTGEFTAMYLASLGVAALGVGYFGAPGLPAQLEDVPLEILEEDLAFLTADPRVDPERVVVMGGSRGGELALLLGQHFAVVKGVIATVPSGLVWAGNGTSLARAAWTLDGAPLAFVPSSGGEYDVDVDSEGRHVRMRNSFLRDIEQAPAPALTAATIRVEETDGPVLLLGGDDDQLWPSCVLAEIAFARLQAAGRTGDELYCFADAGHGFGIPGWSTIGSDESFNRQLGAFLVLGGTPAGNARAGREADTAIRRFLGRL